LTESALLLRTSPSQYQTFEKFCPRKWWLRYIHKLVEPQKGAQQYGLVVHEVNERFMKASATGRGADGMPVDLFPPSWERAAKAEQVILPAEAEQIRRLTEQAIAQGFLARPHGELGSDYCVEQPYERWIRSGEVLEVGVIDLLHAAGVDDYKTTRSRKWALTEEKLRRDAQMLSYGIVWGSAVPGDADCEISHIIYVKDDDYVMRRSVSVSRGELAARALETEATVEQMLALRGIPEDAWESVPGPHPGSDACNAYGGCPFKGVCSKGESPGEYRARMARAAAYRESQARSMEVLQMAQQAAGAPQGSGGGIMSFLSKASPAGAQPPRGPAPLPEAPINPGAAPAAPAARQEAAPPAPAENFLPPPWAAAECRACSGGKFPGFSSSLNPCKVCCVHSARRGARQPESCKRIWVEGGVPRWELEEFEAKPPQGDQVEQVEQVQAAPPAGPQVEQVEQVQVAPPAGPQVQQVEQVEQAEAAPAPAPAVEAPKRARGRPPGSKKAPEVLPTGEISLEQIAERIGEKILGHVLARIADLGKGVQEAELEVLEAMRSESVGYTLFVDCAPQGEKVLDALDLWRQMCDLVVAEEKAESWYALNPFQRRDAVCLKLTQQLEALIDKRIVARGMDSPDTKPFLEVLRSHAGLVVQS